MKEDWNSLGHYFGKVHADFNMYSLSDTNIKYNDNKSSNTFPNIDMITILCLEYVSHHTNDKLLNFPSFTST